jgi:hypothetical protein
MGVWTKVVVELFDVAKVEAGSLSVGLLTDGVLLAV